MGGGMDGDRMGRGAPDVAKMAEPLVKLVHAQVFRGHRPSPRPRTRSAFASMQPAFIGQTTEGKNLGGHGAG